MARSSEQSSEEAEQSENKRCANCGKVTGAASSFGESSESYLRVSKQGPTSAISGDGAFQPDGPHSLMGESTTEYYCSEECAMKGLSATC